MNANKNGKLFERHVEMCLMAYEMRFKSQYVPIIETHQGSTFRIDFWVTTAVGFDEGFYIECKWQSSKGSAASKIIGLVENIKQYYDRPTIVVIGGKESWPMLDHCESKIGNTLVGAFRFDLFMEFCQQVTDGKGVKFIADEFDPAQPRLF